MPFTPRNLLEQDFLTLARQTIRAGEGNEGGYSGTGTNFRRSAWLRPSRLWSEQRTTRETLCRFSA